MLAVKRATERGDTLIEVLVAVSVFGVIVVGAFSLMSRGVAQMYDSMERSEVRLLLNQQTEALTYARDQYLISQSGGLLTTEYDKAAERVWQGVESEFSQSSVPAVNDGCTNPDYAFYTVIDNNGYLQRSTTVLSGVASGFPSPGNGIWMQKIDSSPGAKIPYKDFYIRACWVQNSSSQTQVLSTVVRLYDR
jgi:prepilin-type N-terminal cleavage/methylation domain-containing protein